MDGEQQFVDKEQCASLDKNILGTHYIWGKVYGASCVASVKFKKTEMKDRSEKGGAVPLLWLNHKSKFAMPIKNV